MSQQVIIFDTMLRDGELALQAMPKREREAAGCDGAGKNGR